MSSLGERKSVRVISGKAKRNVLTCFGIIAVAVNLVRSRYAKSPSTFEADEKVSTPLPRPVKRDKEGNIKRTLNALVFSRRKPRRQSGVPRASAPPGKPAGVHAWAPPPLIKEAAHGEQ